MRFRTIVLGNLVFLRPVFFSEANVCVSEARRGGLAPNLFRVKLQQAFLQTTAGFPANYSRLPCKLQQAFLQISYKCVDTGRATCCSVRAATLQSRLSKKVAFHRNQRPSSRLSALVRPCAKPCGVGLAPMTHNYSRLTCNLMGPALCHQPSNAACRKTTAGFPANYGRLSCKLQQAFLQTYPSVALTRLSAHELRGQAVSEASRVDSGPILFQPGKGSPSHYPSPTPWRCYLGFG